MSSAVIAENYSAAKLKEYIFFVEQLGSNIHFHENKWVCSNLRRSPAERSCMFTLYFDRIPALHRETVKSFAAISLKCIINASCSETHHLIRRLTPLECERLQGFPDGWTDIPGASDSARYKALGNSVAIPCVEFIMSRIAAAMRVA